MGTGLQPMVVLPGHVVPAINSAFKLGGTSPTKVISLAIVLPLRDQAGLSDLLRRLYTPGDPAYGHYLTPDQFRSRFGPTVPDYEQVAAFAASHGLTVTKRHANR